jgi:hypothetical protein
MSNVEEYHAEAFRSQSLPPTLIKDETANNITHSRNATAPATTDIIPKSMYVFRKTKLTARSISMKQNNVAPSGTTLPE